MALTKYSQGSGWHFWIRLAGLTGLLLVAVGLVFRHEVEGDWGNIILAAGGFFLLLTLLVELKGAVQLVASRRGALGSNVVVQVVLASILLVGINALSFFRYTRWDWTGEFTISKDFRDQLRQLRGETMIVIYQRHSSFGQASEKQDNYDAAAERKIVEKVKDLAEQFQELGPRFRVEVLDTQDENFQGKLEDLKKNAPELAAAIDEAPENSIFFCPGLKKEASEPAASDAKPQNSLAATKGKIQRLSFHDIYQLDKQASREARDREGNVRGNLILRYQGEGPFVRKLLNLEEKRPRIAVGVWHEMFGLNESTSEFGMSGAKKALAARGFDSRDIILKQWNRFRYVGPAVLTYDESLSEQLEMQLKGLNETIKQREEKIRDWTEEKKLWIGPLPKLNKVYCLVVDDDAKALVKRIDLPSVFRQVGQKLPVENLTDKDQQFFKERFYERKVAPFLTLYEENLKRDVTERDKLTDQLKGLNLEDLTEQRRLTDLRAKLKRMLADCDLLLVPRMTIMDAPNERVIPQWAHALEATQLEAIKDFMKAGKPVLFCLGPPNQPEPDPPDAPKDRLEDLLADLGIKLGGQTVLFNVETKAYAKITGPFLVLGTSVEVPPVAFDWPAGADRWPVLTGGKERAPHPIRTSLRLSNRSVGKDHPLELRLRHPQPVYYEPRPGEKPAVEATFMMTNPDGWNEDQPFDIGKGPPSPEVPKEGDPNKGSFKEKRQVGFPIAVALETSVPRSWYDDSKAKPRKVRVAAIGHGGVLAGPTLTPIKEKLLLDTCNWLLGRDDLLAKVDSTWEYPRVVLSGTENALWQWGTRLGIPLLFVYLGFVVLMVRRMR